MRQRHRQASDGFHFNLEGADEKPIGKTPKTPNIGVTTGCHGAAWVGPASSVLRFQDMRTAQNLLLGDEKARKESVESVDQQYTRHNILSVEAWLAFEDSAVAESSSMLRSPSTQWDASCTTSSTYHSFFSSNLACHHPFYNVALCVSALDRCRFDCGRLTRKSKV